MAQRYRNPNPRWLLAGCLCLLPGCLLSQRVTRPENDLLEKSFQAAMAAQDRGDLSQAESTLRALRAQHPGIFAIDESLGLLYVRREQFPEAIPLLEAATRDAPGSDAAHANLGAAYFRLRRTREALTEFQLAARLNPENARTQQSLGRLWMHEHHPERAAEAFAAALKSNPGDSDLILDRAQALLESNNATQAVAVLSEMPRVDQSVVAQSLLGEANEKLGAYKDAVLHLSRAVELDPDEANTWALGVELLRHWTFDAALQEFEAASANFPESVRMRLGLGTAYFGNRNYAKAVQVFADLLKSHPGNRLDAELLGMSCRAASTEPRPRCDELIAYAQLHPEDAKAATYAAAMIVEGTASDEHKLMARKLLESAIRVDPRMVDAHYELAVLKQNEADWTGSIPQLEAAVRLKPNFAKAHYRLSLAFWRTGRKAEAQAQMQFQEKYHAQEQGDLDQRLRQVTVFLVDVHN